MKVAIVSDYFPPVSPGGAELSAMQLARALQPNVDVEVVTTDFGLRPEYPFPVHYVQLSGVSTDGSVASDPRKLFEGGVKPFGAPLHYAQFARKLGSLARTRQFDLIHTQQLGSEVAAYLSRPLHRLPRVTTVRGYRHLAGKWHDSAATIHGIDTGRPSTTPLARLRRLVPVNAVRSSEHLFAVSEFVRAAYVSGGLARSSHSSAVFNILPQEDVSESELRTARTLVDDVKGPILLFAGRLTDGKGLRMLVNAMPHLLKQIPEATLLIAGGGDQSAYREQAAASRTQYGVRFTGHVSNGVVRSLVAVASAVVVPSLHHEPLARVLLEAIAAGVPVVATPYGGTPEVISHGENGLLVDEVSENSLGASLVDAVTNSSLRDRTRQYDAELVAGRLNPDRTVAATLDVYREAVAA